VFNGKVTDSEIDLQDYGFRFYNPSYGKFLSVDPLSRDYPWLSPFDFVSNNPIENIEVDGRYYIRNVRPTNSHPSRAKQKDRNWVMMITDHRQMEELDRIAAIPFFGIAARLPLTMKRALDPSFQYSLKEWAAFGVETILSLSGYSAIKNASDLGKAILKINRELVGLINNIVIDPEYTEILIDREAAERLANKGIGITTYEDGFIRGLEINENVVKEWKKNFQKEAGDKKLTENQLENMITKNLEKLMDDEKNKIKIEIKETIKKVSDEVKKNDSKK
jgi:RHS repeat-associated protein